MGVKQYFRKEFRLSMFGLEEEDCSDFYISCFQSNRSPFFLMAIRLCVLMACIGILVTSLVLTSRLIEFKYWFTFLTHWGVIFITVTSAFAFAVSLRAFISPIDSSFGLPWYIKAYWVCFNVTLPIAFFITVFYWSLLTSADEVYAINPTLDVLIHAMNSVLMFILLATARHPSRLLHFHHAVLASLVYLAFSLIYYYAGALGPFGTGWIYPMLDWSRPVLAIITVAGSFVGIVVMHLVVVALAAARDALFTNKNSKTMPVTDERYY